MIKPGTELKRMLDRLVYNSETYLLPYANILAGDEFYRLKFMIEGRIPSKKNSRITVKKTGISFPSKAYSAWHASASAQLLAGRVPRKTLSDLAAIVITFFFPDNRVADLTNKAESVMDLMVDMRVIENDNWQNTGMVLLIPQISKSSPGAIVDIFIKK
jgi:Holliday junction resolvase RusA-like endonuclease